MTSENISAGRYVSNSHIKTHRNTQHMHAWTCTLTHSSHLQT